MKAKRYTLSIMIVAILLALGAIALFAASALAASGDGASEEAKRVPIRMIGSFYRDGYEQIDGLEFSLSKDTPSAVYEGASDKEIVISFEDNGPVTCLVTIENDGVSNTYQCGMSGECAIAIELTPGSSYRVEYRLGIKEHSDPAVKTGETVDESSGMIKVYELK